jgi:integrase
MDRSWLGAGMTVMDRVRITVRDYAPRVAELCPRRSRDTYNAGFTRLVAAFGDRPLDAITLPDLTRLRDRTGERVGARIVARARALGRELRSYEPRSHGYGAAENFVRSCRFFFRCAVGDHHLGRSPAADLHAPPRPPAPERALTPDELAEVYRIASTTGHDPELDRLLLEFLRETAARRSGALSLVLGALDSERRAITVTEKGGRSREVPASPQLLHRMQRFALARGAVECGHLIWPHFGRCSSRMLAPPGW